MVEKMEIEQENNDVVPATTTASPAPGASSVVPAAAQKVLDVPELLERMLGYATPLTLFALQRVTTKFKDVITTRDFIKERMTMEPGTMNRPRLIDVTNILRRPQLAVATHPLLFKSLHRANSLCTSWHPWAGKSLPIDDDGRPIFKRRLILDVAICSSRKYRNDQCGGCAHYISVGLFRGPFPPNSRFRQQASWKAVKIVHPDLALEIRLCGDLVTTYSVGEDPSLGEIVEACEDYTRTNTISVS